MWSEGHHLPKCMTGSSHGRELTTLEEMRTLVTPLQACDSQMKLTEGISYHVLEMQLACMCQLLESCGYRRILSNFSQKMGWGK